ncbi:MAG: hypothetical protein R8M14_08515 [Ghiorsea sp.]
MKLKKTITAIAVLGALSVGAATANAQVRYIAEVNTALGSSYNTSSDCIICHSAANNSGGDKGVTAFAAVWKGLASTSTIGALTSGTSLSAADQTTLANATAPTTTATTTTTTTTDTGSSSSGGCVTSAVTTPLMMFLGMLTLGFFVRRKKD